MKIIVLSQYFQTSKEPGVSLLADMVDDFVARGDEVRVVAARHAYMSRADQSREAEEPAGYRIYRTWSGNEKSRGILARIVSFLIFMVTAVGGLVRAGRSDVVFASSPPIFPMLSGWAWARLTGAKFIIEVRDLWPESAIALGIIRNRMLIWMTAWLESFLYLHSDGIVALTNGIAETIRTKHAPRAAIHVARCAVAPSRLAVSENTRSEVRERHGWGGKCVAMYLGTIGYANDVDCLVEAAEALQDRSDLLIVLIGDGARRRVIEERSAGLANVELLAAIPKNEVAPYLAAADIGLCPLRNLALFDSAVPSKLLDYLAAGLPVVAARLKEIAEIASQCGAGLFYAPENAAELAAALRELASNPEKRLAAADGARRTIRGEFLLDQRHADLHSFVSMIGTGAPAAAGPGLGQAQ
jgi:glycosyltransferase involved in cell wall biosynthesis